MELSTLLTFPGTSYLIRVREFIDNLVRGERGAGVEGFLMSLKVVRDGVSGVADYALSGSSFQAVL